MNVIEINNLTKDFGNNKGIFDLSFSLKQGEIVGFLGSNGAGKTTTIRHLMGFEEIENTCERIVMIKDGRLVADENINAMRNKMNKHYEISFSNMEDAIHFQELYSANSYRKNNVVYLLSNQNINHLIRELSKFNIEDINARYQNLEEVFMKYYGGSEK